MSSNPLTNQSYINKDFQTIYPELLDLVKKLTYKWDPTVSNESDPGVLLIKLNAIIADKNNYNIDKNVLECFPDTVTQRENAYKLFEQLGYTMHWYKAASGEITLQWKSEKIEVDAFGGTVSVKVPQFTMVCDENGELVYTILNETVLPTDGKSVTTKAMQGIIRDLTVGSDNLIRPTMLDHRHRIYFPVSNVAENGIFISDANKVVGADNEYEFIWRDPETSLTNGWKAVDNLYTHPLTEKCYKFGVDQTTNTCYLEFSPDIANLMGEGIFIKYLQTDGASGNIIARRVSKYYTDVVIEAGELNIRVSEDSVPTNYSSINNGEDPEDITDAYVNYKKVIGTFDTLVTLRDYLNFIVNDDFEQVSNGVVADRTNDIQSSYTVVTTNEDVTTFKPMLTHKTTSRSVSVPINGTHKDVQIEENVPEMNAFDLKTYFLEYSPWPKFSTTANTDEQKSKFKEAYDKSFRLQLGDIDLDTPEKIQQYYMGAKRVEHDFIPKLPYRPLLFKNKFKLNLTVIPNNMISQTQADEIEKNVYDAVLRQLSSKHLAFGEELSFETVYDICNRADARIKAIALDTLEYTPYAMVYLDDNFATSVRSAFGLTSTPLIYDGKGKEIKTTGGDKPFIPGIYELPIPTEITNSDLSKLTYNELIALDICAKNVLSGTTPLYHSQTDFTHTLEQINPSIIRDIETANTSSEISFTNLSSGSSEYHYLAYPDEDGKLQEGTLSESHMLENETLFLYSPSLKETINYSASVKYLYYTTDEYVGYDVDYIPANADYVLSRGQVLYMLWKEEDAKDAPYQYIRYGEGTILRSQGRLLKSSDVNYATICARLESAGYEGEGQILGDLNDLIYDISDTILSNNKTVSIKEVVGVNLTDKHNYCYWVTKDIESIDGVPYYNMDFKYIPIEATSVSKSFHSGEIYVSNFDLVGHDYVDGGYTLTGNQQIYILTPTQKRISYKEYNELTEQTSPVEDLVTDYVFKDKLVAGDRIKCTGDILYVDNLYTSVDDYLGNAVIGTTIPWGDLVTERTAARLVDAFDTVEMPVSNSVPAIKSFDEDYIGYTYRIEIGKSTSTATLSKVGFDDKVTPISLSITSSSGNYTFKSGSTTYLTATPTNYIFKEGDYFEFRMGPTSAESIKFYSIRIIRADGYSIPVANEVANALGNHSYLVLSNGYRIEEMEETTSTDLTDGVSTYEYILGPNEEFIYTDADKKGLYLHQHGTRIQLKLLNKDIKVSGESGDELPPIYSVKVKVVDTESTHDEQLKSISEDVWWDFRCVCETDSHNNVVHLKSGTAVSVIENQIVALGENTYIKIKQNPQYVSRKNEDGEVSTVLEYDLKYDKLHINSEGIYLGSQTDTLDTMKAAGIRRNVLSKFTLQYKDSETSSWTDLPQTSHPTIGWDGYLLLNIYAGAHDPQRLYRKHNQTITFFSIDKTQGADGEVTLSSTEDLPSDVYFQTSTSISVTGGQGVDMTGRNADNEKLYLSVLAYTKQPITKHLLDGTNHNYEILQDGEDYIVNFKGTNSAITADIECDLPDNTPIILPIEFIQNYSNVFDFSIKGGADGSQAILDIKGDKILFDDNKINKGVYYCVADNLHNLSITYSGEVDLSLIIRPLFSYKYIDAKYEKDKVVPQGLLENRIEAWDTQHIFDYTYQPLYDINIDNPLSPKSYFEAEHFCNKFTIPQISEIQIKTVNKRG